MNLQASPQKISLVYAIRIELLLQDEKKVATSFWWSSLEFMDVVTNIRDEVLSIVVRQ